MTAHLSPGRAAASQGPGEDPHRSLHSETGASPGEHPGRSKNPLVKVTGLAWLEFEKPDLDRAGQFLADFGFAVAEQTGGPLVGRGRGAGAARPASGRRMPDNPPWSQPPLRRSRLPGSRPG